MSEVKLNEGQSDPVSVDESTVQAEHQETTEEVPDNEEKAVEESEPEEESNNEDKTFETTNEQEITNDTESKEETNGEEQEETEPVIVATTVEVVEGTVDSTETNEPEEDTEPVIVSTTVEEVVVETIAVTESKEETNGEEQEETEPVIVTTTVEELAVVSTTQETIVEETKEVTEDTTEAKQETTVEPAVAEAKEETPAVSESNQQEPEVQSEEDKWKARHTLNSALGKTFLESAHRQSRPELNVKDLWAKEEALSLEERRARYAARNILTLQDIPRWSSYGLKLYSNAAEQELSSKYQPRTDVNDKIALIRGDITTLEIDAVVNAANESLMGGGGIDGAIHRAAGEMLREECRTLHGCPTGFTKTTRGYNLPAKYILHAVGPLDQDADKLRSCYVTCLQEVLTHNIKSVAFCGISTGIFGFPLEPASKIALGVIREWLETNDNKDKVDCIVICTYLEKELACYEKLMPAFFPLERPAPAPAPAPVAAAVAAVVIEEVNEEDQQVPEVNKQTEEMTPKLREEDDRKRQEENNRRAQEYIRKRDEREVDRKKKKEEELRSQTNALQRKLQEETDRRQKEIAVSKQKKLQQQGKPSKKKETPKPFNPSSSTATLFTVGNELSGEKDIVKSTSKPLSKSSEEGIPWQVYGLSVIVVGAIALHYVKSRMGI